MHRRLAVKLVVALSLVALSGGGCSRSGDKHADTPPPGTRPLAAIWADVLGERDTLHQIFIKELESVTHQDCADAGAAARRIDELFSEMANELGSRSGDDGHMRAVGDAMSRASGVLAKVRETALAESPGAWVNLRFPLDQSLRDLESFFSGDDLGQESVVRRPGFEMTPPPTAASPI
jgi:hypothetical protein